MSNYFHQQFEDISKKSIKAMFRDSNSKNSDTLLETISLAENKMGNACHICECYCVFQAVAYLVIIF